MTNRAARRRWRRGANLMPPAIRRSCSPELFAGVIRRSCLPEPMPGPTLADKTPRPEKGRGVFVPPCRLKPIGLHAVGEVLHQFAVEQMQHAVGEGRIVLRVGYHDNGSPFAV